MCWLCLRLSRHHEVSAHAPRVRHHATLAPVKSDQCTPALDMADLCRCMEGSEDPTEESASLAKDELMILDQPTSSKYGIFEPIARYS